ncbi:MAG: phenylalanine--tRNA ligase subunit alpha [Firmicutes bacterium]|nr:phenylalanine--tRNA ligase subunit alpha [Bacillota bacterium]MCL5038794.1 phenylalanine--tRNA ligase subunit alpha [Bacillota bacterium]
MRERLPQITQEALQSIQIARNLEDLKNTRVRFLGRKGLLTEILRGMGNLPPEERPLLGQLANASRQEIEARLSQREMELKEEEKESRWKREALDVTLPGVELPRGHKHPLRQVWEEIEAIFISMGFEVAHGPEVETDFYNFEALNIPPDHPARDMQDSFFFTEEILLRTQTSPVQIRTMQARAPRLPVKIIAPGRVYRRDDDATHSPMFHQVEGLLVDTGVTFGDLKGTLETFARRLYGPGTRIRLRPSYFPFTEPSAEVDVSCTICGGQGCRVCKGTGWLEILGTGMVHPGVLQNGGYDPEKVTGFAFGMGIERVAMLKYGIDDLRHFFTNDIRFLEQF